MRNKNSQFGVVLFMSLLMVIVSLFNVLVVGCRRFRANENKCSTILMKVIPVCVLCYIFIILSHLDNSIMYNDPIVDVANMRNMWRRLHWRQRECVYVCIYFIIYSSVTNYIRHHRSCYCWCIELAGDKEIVWKTE
jgi:hypothetical protein